ncbi:MAG TPA: glutamine--tRNA ligase/YqeY domain fusion protein [Myxococcota bacterium]|nr:glutamine--tRNA ligase/YqeY domain fusion protein [Myxococcota bacterium]
MADDATAGSDFIRDLVARDVRDGKYGGRVVTRFPPEPNGYLHIGHAKSIALNFGLAREFGGRCHLRFDDTNPATEETEFVESMLEDVRWLGFDWGGHLYYASDYFGRLYEYAQVIVRKGLAFVCDLSSEEVAARRGTLTEPGIPSPYRERSVAENLDLFERMKAGEFAPGSRVLRAKIDMASPVLPMRDPILYRISTAIPHHRTGRAWNVYPMYDFAHPLSDAIEGITHSLCTLEFADHRPLYEWVLDAAGIPRPRTEQTEFARGNVSHTVVSKRVLRRLVEEGHVRGWDDPRMPTLAAARRRGYPPEALRRFWAEVGVAKRENVIELARLEAAVREELNRTAPRALAVLRPLKVVIVNYPEGRSEEVEAINNPEDPAAGVRKLPFSRELWIERDDFLEDPPKKFFRLAPGREVRLRFAYLVRCEEVVKDASGAVVELRCTYDPATRGGDAPDGRKVRGTIHWVSARHARRAEVRLYDTLFTVADPLAEEGRDFTEFLNPGSLEVVSDAFLEPSLAGAAPGTTVQFERLGYFCADPDGTAERPVWNRTVTLRDSWGKLVRRGDAD